MKSTEPPISRCRPVFSAACVVTHSMLTLVIARCSASVQVDAEGHHRGREVVGLFVRGVGRLRYAVRLRSVRLKAVRS